MAQTAVIGFMGAGKTTAARVLGESAVDVDEVIEARLGRRVQDVFAQDGEAVFREVEEQVALELLAHPAVEVVALGGGATGSARVRKALAGCRVIWLETAWEDAWRRVEGSGGRPLASDMYRFRELHDARQSVYEALADVIVPASHSRQIRAVVNALAGLPPSGTRMLWATSASSEYPIYIGSGLVTEHRFWPSTVTGRRLLVTDYQAGQLYADRFTPRFGEVRITPGEQSKTIAHAELVWKEMGRQRATRSDVLVALGGGVVGDLAGFCAATYQRGMRIVQVPTTLVAQVDSAIGGKTGVDLVEAKNYVGAFHQPSAVIVDPATLSTLPAEELAAGYAEVLKTGMISGGALWGRLRAGASPTDPQVIAACAHVKVRTVSQDEEDRGLRQILNLGHTVAHAIETATGYARYRHGEAVGLGLLAELRMSGADELRAQAREMLLAAGLPVRLEGTDVETVICATQRDKKRTAEGPVPFVLCTDPGRPRNGCSVGLGDLRAAVRELIAA